MRRHPLPRSLDPLPGEGLDGYLLRLSYRLERPPMRVAVLTGLVQPSGQRVVSAGLLTHMPEGLRESFAQVTRLTASEVARLCLSSMSSRYPPASAIQRDWHLSGPVACLSL